MNINMNNGTHAVMIVISTVIDDNNTYFFNMVISIRQTVAIFIIEKICFCFDVLRWFSLCFFF